MQSSGKRLAVSGFLESTKNVISVALLGLISEQKPMLRGIWRSDSMA